jgi:hypothetical protein
MTTVELKSQWIERGGGGAAPSRENTIKQNVNYDYA